MAKAGSGARGPGWLTPFGAISSSHPEAAGQGASLYGNRSNGAAWDLVHWPIPKPESDPMGTAARPLTERVILLVEDEDAVRHIVGRMLTDAGFSLVEARNGEEALAQVSRLRGKVHLVVTDVAMPGMSGNALAATILERWPNLPVLLISGALLGDEPDRFLRKPFTPEALIEAVERLVPPRKL